MKYLAIGLMTGSSMDGIDGALLETDGLASANFRQGASLSYSSGFHLLLRIAEYALQGERGSLQKAKQNFDSYLKQYLQKESLAFEWQETIGTLKAELNLKPGQDITLGRIIEKLTLLHKELVDKLITEAGLTGENIDFIGFHGQNFYHNPAEKITFQGGDGQLLADSTGIVVVNDFRANDVKMGGQGAPFAPLYHQVLAKKSGLCPVGIINCGGIANITLITGLNEENILGFDAGPGNVLIDRYIRQKTLHREWMDKDGGYGRNGQVNTSVLSRLKERAIVIRGENFLQKRPPKALDSHHFTLIPELDSLSLEDACATLEAFTAKCIVDSLDLVDVPIPQTWILAGGGWNNPVITNSLLHYLQEKLGVGVKVLQAREAGWESAYLEAEIFAYLAARTLKKLPISLPAVTGVPEPAQGGKVYKPTHYKETNSKVTGAES